MTPQSKALTDAIDLATKQLDKARGRSSASREGCALPVWVVEELLVAAIGAQVR